MKIIQSIRGMNDILPQQTSYWQELETILRDVVACYGYQEIRLPIVEKTELFKRSIGEVTDIVEKEMYTFEDRNGDSITLRPEGTASCVRAAIEHGLLYHQEQRWWYMGPMFRHERPQKGRYRQFHQIGVEAFGLVGPDVDVELLLMTARFWRHLGITDQVKLQINSLGSIESRNQYRGQLVEYFTQYHADLDEDSKRRLHTNPLRILDSKTESMQEIIMNAPQLLEYLDDESLRHFAGVKELLDAAEIPYSVNPRLVRGLDYYNKTVFEWVTEHLGAQGTVCAGGRYDGLVEQLGGNHCPAVGFAMGLERLASLLENAKTPLKTKHEIGIYFIMLGQKAETFGLLMAEKLRDTLPHLYLMTNCGGGSIKSQFRKADKSGAKLALVIGEDELTNNKFTVKYLREERPQIAVSFEELVKLLG